MKLNSFRMKRLLRGILSLSLSAAMAVSGLAGSTVFADEAKYKADMKCLDELTSDYYKNQNKKYSELLRGDFDVPPFAANDNSQVMNYKILTAQTDKLLTYRSEWTTGGFFKWDADNPYSNDKNTTCNTVQENTKTSLKDAWAEMLCTGMTKDTDKEFKMEGAYWTDVYYGKNPIEAYNNAVNNDPYLSNNGNGNVANRSDDNREPHISGSHDKNQAYCRSVVGWGRDNTIWSDIQTRYQQQDEEDIPCYCMIVFNNVNWLDEKLAADYGDGTANYFGNPWVYVLFFHDFNAEDRQEDYLNSQVDDLEKDDTLEDLKKKGIECEAKDVKSTVSYKYKDDNTGADLYAAENNTGAPATVTTSYQVEEGITKSVTQEKSSSFSYTNQLTLGTNLEYEFKTGAIIGEGTTKIGFSIQDMNEWHWEWGKSESTQTDNSKVETHSKEFSQEMPAYTRNTLSIQPTEITMSFKYSSAVTPTYKTDVLLYSPYLHFNNNQSNQWYNTKEAFNHYTTYANMKNPDYYKDLTPEELFDETVVSYKHNDIKPTPAKSWIKTLADHGDAQACLLLGSLRYSRPTLPMGGLFSITKKGVRISSSEFEPTLSLQTIKPSITRIDMVEGEEYDLEDIDVEGTNSMAAPFYGFDKKTSGEWQVRNGYEDLAEIKKNSAGNYDLIAKKPGTAVIWFVPTKIDSSKLSREIDIRGITVSIKEKDDPSKNPENTAEEAAEKGFGAVGDTLVLPTDGGKNLKLTFEGTPSQNSVITVAKGNRFTIDGDFSDFRSSAPKNVSVTNKGLVTAKKSTGSTPTDVTFTSDSDGLTYTLTVYVLDPADGSCTEVISGNSVTVKKMKIKAKTTDQIIDISMKGVPLNSVVGTVVDKKGATGTVSGHESIFEIGSDGHYHLAAQINKKGKVKIPFKVNGKKFAYTLKIS